MCVHGVYMGAVECVATQKCTLCVCVCVQYVFGGMYMHSVYTGEHVCTVHIQLHVCGYAVCTQVYKCSVCMLLCVRRCAQDVYGYACVLCSVYTGVLVWLYSVYMMYEYSVYTGVSAEYIECAYRYTPVCSVYGCMCPVYTGALACGYAVRLPVHTGVYGGESHLPSRISRVIDRDTTSLEARSFATGAYLSMNLSPWLLMRMPPSPRHPSVMRQPAPYMPAKQNKQTNIHKDCEVYNSKA